MSNLREGASSRLWVGTSKLELTNESACMHACVHTECLYKS